MPESNNPTLAGREAPTVEGLMPCPFCGEEPNFQAHPRYGPRYFCDWGFQHAIFIGGMNEAEARKNWNTRSYAERLARSPGAAAAGVAGTPKEG